MEMKMSASGSGCKKRPPSRLQKHAPASLQLEQVAAGAGTGAGPAVWGDGRAPIPLLSPLVVSPTVPVWEADQAGAAARKEGGGDQVAEGRSGAEQQQLLRGAARHGGSGERQAHDVSPRPPAPAVGAGWRHPALSAPMAEPASLVPLFQSQCALEVRNAQQ
ncbi:uncharacterized protein [Miscanthus floridulus]|uniref:uncharacterized protein n=1 Tax=Miscanthus floridulus TaxID=154761 RepID=UPI0034590383